MDKFKVGILGADTRIGAQLLGLLLSHPMCEVTSVSSSQNQGRSVPMTLPQLISRCSLTFDTELNTISQSDIIFNAGMDYESEELAAVCIKNKSVFIDLATGFRIIDENEYKSWYGGNGFVYPALHEASIYGLPELMRDQMVGKVLVSNPGAVSAAVILALAPALLEGLVDADSMVVDAKIPYPDCSPLDGFRRSSDMHPTGDLGELKPFIGGVFRETGEIEQMLSLAAERNVRVTIVPTAVPSARQLMVTCMAKAALSCNSKTLRTAYDRIYSDELFVRVLPSGVEQGTSQVLGTNFCDIGLNFIERTGTVIITASLDTLMKGSAGQAVQNMNALLSMPEYLGLI